jgi:hypothetical protein
VRPFSSFPRKACSVSGPYFVCRWFDNVLGNPDHAPDDGGLRRIAHVLRPPLRLLTGNKNEPTIQDFAPSANVMLAEFHEEDRPIMVAVPTEGRNLLLARVDAHERSWHSSHLPVKSKHLETASKRKGVEQAALLQFLTEEN